MTLWRYKVVPVEPLGAKPVRGEIEAASGGDARMRLRRAGFRILDIQAGTPPASNGYSAVGRITVAYLRRRRVTARADVLDAIATLLESGVPLAPALSTLAAGGGQRQDFRQRFLVALRVAVEAGDPLADAAERQPAWFDPTEIAQIRAAENGGTLGETLRAMSRQLEESGELGSRVVGILVYPAIIALVGLGVVVFLATQTLPTLVGVLADAGVQTPALTRGVMAVGAVVPWAAPLSLLLIGGFGVVSFAALRSREKRRSEVDPPRRVFVPRLMRRIATSEACDRLARMLASGVPMVEALEVLSPTAGTRLGRCLERVAGAVRRGESLANAFARETWFEPEFVRIIEAAEAAGTLEDALLRLAARYRRDARRKLDRLTALLEPVVILVLAALVGMVVLAAVLPLTKLQEVL